VSQFAKSELVSLGIAPADRIHVIPNGVDHILQVPSAPEVATRLLLAPHEYALALANTQAHKNIGVLLRAFARPEMAGLRLVLAGKATAAEFATQGHPVPKGTIFGGYVSDGEMGWVQENALAVCTPSRTEGFGMPPVEGMLLGTPAVIAPCGALPEMCGPGALHADPQDPAAWAETLLSLRDWPDRRAALIAKGRAQASRFTWAAAAERLEAVLEDVLRPLSK